MFVVASVSWAAAQEPHKAWWNYLKGDWSYEIRTPPDKGTAVYRLAAKRNALIVRFTDEDGDVAVEVAGWRKDTETMFSTGYGSDGHYWQFELNKISTDRAEGPCISVSADGSRVQGTFVIEKIDNDHFHYVIKGKDAEGEKVETTGKFARKNNSK